jgi:predicted polyphosphate/ATP-dependent NAD kinase
MKIGFLINPIAGMGGRVGLKGTDGLAAEAIRRGAQPIAAGRALETLRHLRATLDRRVGQAGLSWVTCSGSMGEDALREAGFGEMSIVHSASAPSAVEDTVQATRAFLAADVDLILFCGGDGTARDIAGVARASTPILGIPSGVKMYSGVFGVTPQRTAEIVIGFLSESLELAEVDILDLDEQCYRQGEWVVRLVCSARTPYEPTLTQAAKAFVIASDDATVKAEIADDLREEIAAQEGTLLLLGPGSTVREIADRLGVQKTLLGVDAVLDGALVGSDLNEREILDLLDRHPPAALILSPIGAQGFVLGRGNLQISPAVIRRIGPENITVAATPAKLGRTPVLRFDTGDTTLDQELGERAFISVVTGYHRRRLVPVGR